MNTLLSENPWMVSFMLGAVGAALIFAWLQTGKKVVAIVGVICFLLIPGAFAVAARWQTDREVIELILHETAAAVEANDHAQAVSVIGDDQTKANALAELPRYVFSLARVNQVRHIEVFEQTSPPTAVAELVVKVDVSGKGGGFSNVRVLRLLELKFEKRGEKWLVTSYHHAPVVGGQDRNRVIGQ